MGFLDNIFKKKKKMDWVVFPDGGELELDDLVQTVNELKKYQWTHKKWVSTPALIDKSSGSIRQFGVQKFDNKHFDLKEDGWSHDHCEICWATISEGDNKKEFEIEGYNFGNSWVCNFCFDNFVNPDNLQDSIKKFKTIKK